MIKKGKQLTHQCSLSSWPLNKLKFLCLKRDLAVFKNSWTSSNPFQWDPNSTQSRLIPALMMMLDQFWDMLWRQTTVSPANSETQNCFSGTGPSRKTRLLSQNGQTLTSMIAGRKTAFRNSDVVAVYFVACATFSMLHGYRIIKSKQLVIQTIV